MKLQAMDYKSIIAYFNKSKFLKYGLPFVLFIVGGSFGLREFTSIRYKYKPVVTLKREEIEALGITMKKPEEVTLEAQYEKVKEMDTKNWENVRISRPWEKDGKEI